MARGPARSQRASRSQPGPSQSQRRRRADDDEEDVDDNGAHGVEDDAMDGGDGDSDIKRKANDLVRLAIFSEHRRTPLRREEINKKVMGSGTRAFNAVLQAAQVILRDTFGMELVELQKNLDGDDVDDGQEATGAKKKAASTGTKTYILRSTLHPTIIERASLTDATILEEESADLPDPDDDDAESFPRAYGSIISWSGSDHLGALGILYVVLALILVSGRVLSDADLRTHLKRLSLDSGAEVPLAAASTQKALTIDAYLALAQRQGFLERGKVGDTGAAKKAGKRARGGAADDDGAQFEWRWGPRAHAEVGEAGVGRFVAEFMAERAAAEDEDEDEDEQEAGDRARRERERHRANEMEVRVAKVMRGIEQGAGGPLLDVR